MDTNSVQPGIDVRADAFTDFLGTLSPNWGDFNGLSTLVSKWVGFLMLLVLIGGVVLVILGIYHGGLTGGERSEAAVKGRTQLTRGGIIIAGIALLAFVIVPIYNALTAV